MVIASLLDELKLSTQVTTGIALVAFLSVIGLAAYRAKLKRQRQMLTDLPEVDRAAQVDLLARRWKLTADGLSPEARANLIQEEIRRRDQQMKLGMVAATVLIALAITLTFVKGSPPAAGITKPPIPQVVAQRDKDGSVALTVRFDAKSVPEGARLVVIVDDAATKAEIVRLPATDWAAGLIVDRLITDAAQLRVRLVFERPSDGVSREGDAATAKVEPLPQGK